MAKYYVPFVNLNTFIYEPCGLEPNEYLDQSDVLAIDGTGVSDSIYFLTTPPGVDSEGLIDGSATPWGNVRLMTQNTLGSISGNTKEAVIVSPLNKFKNSSFYLNLPNTASFATALNLKRNGPYGYSTWKQIRSHENPLTRNQKKRNILTTFVQQNLKLENIKTSMYSDSSFIEVFREPVFSSREKPLIINFPKGQNIYRASFEMGSMFKYFENDRLNDIYAPYDSSNPMETDPALKENFLDKAFKLIGGFGVPAISVEYAHTVFPQKSSLEYNKRIRTNFYHPWKDAREQRKMYFQLANAHTVEDYRVTTAESSVQTKYSRWVLDAPISFLTDTDSKINIAQDSHFATSRDYPGKLQTIGYLKTLQSKNRSHSFFEEILPTPRFSYAHTITPLTSCVGPHGMDIEGVNNGSLFSDLTVDDIPSGEAYWDAGSQYGTNPFYNSYEEFVDDIKKVAKDYAFVPEFRSSLVFDELQDAQNKTPQQFLEVLGGKVNKDSTSANIAYYIDSINSLGTTEIGHVSASSSDSDFFQVYSHSDFMKNFDVVQEVANITNKPLFKMTLTCKGIKKFVPYEGFYPAERTVQIAEKFRDSIVDNCYYTGSGTGNNVGDILTTDDDRYVYFNNIMTPMFAPGIMFNSIKSGIAVDYPIHTSSLTLENGGVNIYDDDYYIQKPFDERVPFEALLEPTTYLINKEIHCSEPHPSGNLSGSAQWSGTGDTTEYQLMMHNFLAETPNFFLQDQNFSFIASKRSDEVNINLISGSLYGFEIKLYKSQNKTSNGEVYGTTPVNSLNMTGSGVKETFTMYSRPSAFGPPSRITGSNDPNFVNGVTASYSDLGYNWPFTPSYYDGISSAAFIFNPSETRGHTLEEIFNGGVFLEERIRGFDGNSGVDMDSSFANNSVGEILLNKTAKMGSILGLYDDTYDEDYFLSSGYSKFKNSCSHILSSLNVNLGIIKDIDLLDDDTSDTVKVAVDISSDQKSQIIIQPKWETPMFNFQSYSNSDTISLPLVGSQSVPRGIWHQYGAIEEDPKKGVFMQISDVTSNNKLKQFADLAGAKLTDLSQKLGLSTQPVKLGKTASKKVVREAIIAVPFYDYTPGARFVGEERKFIKIPRGVIGDAIQGNGKQNIIDMVNKMQRFVMPPMFNFLEDQDIDPITMYIFDFKHTFDQEDLGAIWQNLPPKLMTEFQTEEKKISHTFEEDELLSLAALEEEGDPKLIMKKMKWMVFKVKQKAEQNYYDKIVGETQTLNKKSPYSHNWPYDYFSLVELAKIETKVDFAVPPVERPEESVITIPNVGSVVVPLQPPAALPAKNRRDVIGDVNPTPRTQTNKASTSKPEKKVEISKKKEVKRDLPRKTSEEKARKRDVDPRERDRKKDIDPRERTRERYRTRETPKTKKRDTPSAAPKTRKATPPKAKKRVDPPRPTKTQKKTIKAKRKAGRKNIKGIKK